MVEVWAGGVWLRMCDGRWLSCLVIKFYYCVLFFNLYSIYIYSKSIFKVNKLNLKNRYCNKLSRSMVATSLNRCLVLNKGKYKVTGNRASLTFRRCTLLFFLFLSTSLLLVFNFIFTYVYMNYF